MIPKIDLTSKYTSQHPWELFIAKLVCLHLQYNGEAKGFSALPSSLLIYQQGAGLLLAMNKANVVRKISVSDRLCWMGELLSSAISCGLPHVPPLSTWPGTLEEQSVQDFRRESGACLGARILIPWTWTCCIWGLLQTQQGKWNGSPVGKARLLLRLGESSCYQIYNSNLASH